MGSKLVIVFIAVLGIFVYWLYHDSFELGKSCTVLYVAQHLAPGKRFNFMVREDKYVGGPGGLGMNLLGAYSGAALGALAPGSLKGRQKKERKGKEKERKKEGKKEKDKST